MQMSLMVDCAVDVIAVVAVIVVVAVAAVIVVDDVVLVGDYCAVGLFWDAEVLDETLLQGKMGTIDHLCGPNLYYYHYYCTRYLLMGR
jgi:hypothetical protein